MADPTRAEIESQISNTVKILDVHRNNVGVSAGNYISREDTLIQSLETNFGSEWLAAMQAFRGDMDTAIRRAAQLMAPGLREYGRLVGAPEIDMQTIITRIKDYFIANTLRVTSRQFTFANPAADGGNVGTGVINRLNVDEDGFAIENQTADAKEARIVADEHSGARKHEERFVIRSTSKLNPDLLLITGSGKSDTLKGLSGSDSLQYIQNPSFDESTGSGGSFSLTGWSINTPANVSAITATYYRDYEGAGTPASVRFAAAANALITQDISVNRTSFNPAIPYYAQVAWRRDAAVGGDGTVTFRFGASSVSVVAAAQVGWQILRIALGTGNWFKNFDESTFTVEVERSGASVGNIDIDDVIIAPFQPFDGSWYAPVGGATKWLWDDFFTWTDSEVGAIIQHWFWRAFGRYLPATTGGAITWADP